MFGSFMLRPSRLLAIASPMMALTGQGQTQFSQQSLDSFAVHLKSSKRIMALLGAGLSASSGLPTFRGAGGYWRAHEATDLATPEAFHEQPALVWQFYNYRRHLALRAQPNRAHLALAELARRKPDFLTISQNVCNIHSNALSHPQADSHSRSTAFLSERTILPRISHYFTALSLISNVPASIAIIEKMTISSTQSFPLSTFPETLTAPPAMRTYQTRTFRSDKFHPLTFLIVQSAIQLCFALQSFGLENHFQWKQWQEWIVTCIRMKR